VLAVQVQGHRLGLHTQGDLVPIAIKEVLHLGVLEHGPHRVPGEPHRVVLHRLASSVQADGHLADRTSGEEMIVCLRRKSGVARAIPALLT